MLAAEIAGNRGYAKQYYIADKRFRIHLHQAGSEKHQERTTGPIAKQCQADDHVGEMMILHYGKKPHEKDLV
jgi:hypothetical protein